MKKILNILPNSIAGTLILRGFSAGFRANGMQVLERDFRELKIEDIEIFKPDMIFGYDYGFLMSKDEDLKNYIKERSEKFRFVHYFADEPDGKLAYVDAPQLFEEYKFLNATTFIWDKDFLEVFENSHYLPLAVNANAYKPEIGAPKTYDISFVGRPLTIKRQEILAALIKTFGKRVNIFSYERHFLRSLDDMKNTQLLTEEEMETYKNAYRGFLTTEKELAEVYQRSKINVNITLQGKSSLNYRVFEIPASCGFLITDYMDDLEENFEISRDLEAYRDIGDLVDKIKFYLKNPQIAERIAINGAIKTAKKHSFTARANTLLRICGFKV